MTLTDILADPKGQRSLALFETAEIRAVEALLLEKERQALCEMPGSPERDSSQARRNRAAALVTAFAEALQIHG